MEKNRKVATLLAMVGGLFGLHKFYLKDVGAGIFYLILTFMTLKFFPIAAILGVLDAFNLINMSDQSFDVKYNNKRPDGSSVVGQRRRRSQRQNDVIRERARHNNRQLTSKQRNNPFRKSADRKYAEYDLEGALEDYEKATEITPADMDMHFNMACIHSLKENTDKSLYHLEQAFDLGFKDVEKIKTIDNLAFLRIQPEYDTFTSNGYKRGARAKSIEPPTDDLLQNDALLAQLNKLKEMRERGLLSEKEFMYEKQRLTKR